MSDLYISWPDYHHKIEQLAVKIYQSSWEFNQIVCLARGGLRVGDILSRIYNQPLAILSTSSYSDMGKQERNN
ncbi:MAG: phosphoribosyltransferase, partial [Dolichospermum sp.]